MYATACIDRHTHGRARATNLVRRTPVITISTISSNATVPRPTASGVGTTICAGVASPPSSLTAMCAMTITDATTAHARCAPCASTRCRIFRISRSVASSPVITAPVSASSVKTPA
ncbi:hypothetical protein GCM10009527_044160 [Actinomadura nitritigenes]